MIHIAIIPETIGNPTTNPWICDCSMLGKFSKDIFPDCGLMVIYYGTKEKVTWNKSKSFQKYW